MKKLTPFLLAAVLVAAGCNTGTSIGENETIKIGVIAPMTGNSAAYGQEMQRILDYALDKVNANYAEAGYQFELVYEDGQCGTVAANAFQKLTDVDGIQYVLGGACSSESLAIAPLLEEKDVVAISALSSSPELDGISPNFFSLSYSDAGNAEGIAAEMSKYTKVAILTEQNDYNIALHDSVLAALGEGVEVVADETVTKGATDFRNALQKVKAAEPEIVFFNPNVGVTAETMIKQLAEMDWAVQKIGTFTLMDESYLTLAPEVLEGTLVVDTPKITSAEFVAMSEAVTTAKGTVEDLGAFYTAATYDALTTLAEAIVNGKNVPADVLAGLRSGTFEGYLGSISFGDETFVKGIGTAVYSVKDGVWTQM
ncbi:ABC transporter substrate-binding protein [Candidatus Peregrinibacteria bacterium]|nr:MAG: ABC transporter substrate-binding protein [Candidatus Peregrinibacteria bacterium]